MAQSTNNSILLLCQLLEESFDKQSWHGPNLRGAIRRVDAALASWRPGPGRRSIAEITAHAAYWKYVCRRRLTQAKRGSFPLRGSNWFDFTAPLPAQDWKQLVALLDQQHEQLIASVRSLAVDDLKTVPRGAKITNEKLIYSMALHDVYHAGQIQLIKRLRS